VLYKKFAPATLSEVRALGPQKPLQGENTDRLEIDATGGFFKPKFSPARQFADRRAAKI
jgi:hypothetical protein